MPGTDPLRPRVVCAYCMRRNVRFRHFCRRCGAPLTAYAAIAPLEQVYTLGHAYRRATDRHVPRIVLMGWWLSIGLPMAFGTIVAGVFVTTNYARFVAIPYQIGDTVQFAQMIYQHAMSWTMGAGVMPASLRAIMIMAWIGSVLLCYLVLLIKCTWCYLTQRPYDWSGSEEAPVPPADPDDPDAPLALDLDTAVS